MLRIRTAGNGGCSKGNIPQRAMTCWNACLWTNWLKGDYIDGYKTVGASCHEASAFVDINGYSLSDRKFEIECNLEETDTLSYQDSFKWYSYSRSKAYNYENPDSSYNLDTTDLNLYGDTGWGWKSMGRISPIRLWWDHTLLPAWKCDKCRLRKPGWLPVDKFHRGNTTIRMTVYAVTIVERTCWKVMRTTPRWQKSIIAVRSVWRGRGYIQAEELVLFRIWQWMVWKSWWYNPDQYSGMNRKVSMKRNQSM